MSRLADNAARRRPNPKDPTQNLSDSDRAVYNAIRGKEAAGIAKGYLIGETKLPVPLITKSINSLKAKNLIKVVTNIQNQNRRGQQHYMAVGFEPSAELTGGVWYEEGKLDTNFIQILKGECLKQVSKLKVATVEGISDSIHKSGRFKIACSLQQIGEIVRSLVLDNELVEVNNNGSYRCASKGEASKTGALASIPCGVCPRMDDCTPDGIISPKNCAYYTKWLDF